MKTIVSEKGQITIPKRLRDRLGIRPGSVLDFEEEHGRLVATKVVERDPVDAVYGALALPAPTDALLDELRGAGDRGSRPSTPTSCSTSSAPTRDSARPRARPCARACAAGR
jgi:antitoxin PrlF